MGGDKRTMASHHDTNGPYKYSDERERERERPRREIHSHLIPHHLTPLRLCKSLQIYYPHSLSRSRSLTEWRKSFTEYPIPLLLSSSNGSDCQMEDKVRFPSLSLSLIHAHSRFRTSYVFDLSVSCIGDFFDNRLPCLLE